MTVTGLAYVQASLLEIFDDLNQGLDVAPGKTLRLEGYMQALIHTGVASAEQMLGVMEQSYEQVYKTTMPPLLRLDVEKAVLPIPCNMRRAPVKP